MFVCRNRTSFFSGNEKGRARVVQFLWVLPTIMKTALDRGYGKPMQMQDISLDVTVPVDVTAQIRRLMLKEDTEAHAGQETNKN